MFPRLDLSEVEKTEFTTVSRNRLIGGNRGALNKARRFHTFNQQRLSGGGQSRDDGAQHLTASKELEPVGIGGT